MPVSCQKRQMPLTVRIKLWCKIIFDQYLWPLSPFMIMTKSSTDYVFVLSFIDSPKLKFPLARQSKFSECNKYWVGYTIPWKWYLKILILYMQKINDAPHYQPKWNLPDLHMIVNIDARIGSWKFQIDLSKIRYLSEFSRCKAPWGCRKSAKSFKTNHLVYESWLWEVQRRSNSSLLEI